MSSIARAAIGKSVKSSATIYTRRWKQWCDYCENANISPLPAVGYDVATPENIISMIASLCDPDANNQADGTPLRASTADQIHSALKHHYWYASMSETDSMAVSNVSVIQLFHYNWSYRLKHNCQDNWVCNVSSGKWEGNPCSHVSIWHPFHILSPAHFQIGSLPNWQCTLSLSFLARCLEICQGIESPRKAFWSGDEAGPCNHIYGLGTVGRIFEERRMQIPPSSQGT